MTSTPFALNFWAKTVKGSGNSKEKFPTDLGYRHESELMVKDTLIRAYGYEYLDNGNKWQPPSLLEMSLDCMHILNEKIDKDFQERLRRYDDFMCAGVKPEAIKSLKPGRPSYWQFDSESYFQYLTETGAIKFYPTD